MKEYTAYFVVDCYDGGETYSEAGFIPADTFAEAMCAVEKYYGKCLAVVKHLELMDTPVLTMSPETAGKLLADIFI